MDDKTFPLAAPARKHAEEWIEREYLGKENPPVPKRIFSMHEYLENNKNHEHRNKKPGSRKIPFLDKDPEPRENSSPTKPQKE